MLWLKKAVVPFALLLVALERVTTRSLFFIMQGPSNDLVSYSQVKIPVVNESPDLQSLAKNFLLYINSSSLVGVN